MRGKPRICGNCTQGRVDGGAGKRILKEIQHEQREKDRKLGQIKEKNKDKKKAIEKEIKKESLKKTQELQKQYEERKITNCGKCGGSGYKQWKKKD